jgi:hypothetical protein
MERRSSRNYNILTITRHTYSSSHNEDSRGMTSKPRKPTISHSFSTCASSAPYNPPIHSAPTLLFCITAPRERLIPASKPTYGFLASMASCVSGGCGGCDSLNAVRRSSYEQTLLVSLLASLVLKHGRWEAEGDRGVYLLMQRRVSRTSV